MHLSIKHVRYFRERHVMETRGHMVVVHRERHRRSAADLHDLVVSRMSGVEQLIQINAG
jgi:hypothetical protein